MLDLASVRRGKEVLPLTSRRDIGVPFRPARGVWKKFSTPKVGVPGQILAVLDSKVPADRRRELGLEGGGADPVCQQFCPIAANALILGTFSNFWACLCGR